MSRSGYSEDLDPLDLGRWRGQVASAIRGKRGQKLLSDLLRALDEMKDKRLVADELETRDGEYCALGVLGKARGVDMKNLDQEDSDAVAAVFDVAPQLAREIVYLNDENYYKSEEDRFNYMRSWVAKQIKQTATA